MMTTSAPSIWKPTLVPYPLFWVHQEIYTIIPTTWSRRLWYQRLKHFRWRLLQTMLTRNCVSTRYGPLVLVNGTFRWYLQSETNLWERLVTETAVQRAKAATTRSFFAGRASLVWFMSYPAQRREKDAPAIEEDSFRTRRFLLIVQLGITLLT